jgi:predicted nucleic acid-binding protein
MPTKEKEQEFDWNQHRDDVEAAKEEAAQAYNEPIDNEITQSEWNLMLQRRGQDDANRLFAMIEEHGSVNIVADPEPPAEDETAIDETYADAEADTGQAKQKKDDDKKK